MCEDVASPDAQEMNDALADDNIEPVEALTAVHVYMYYMHMHMCTRTVVRNMRPMIVMIAGGGDST